MLHLLLHSLLLLTLDLFHTFNKVEDVDPLSCSKTLDSFVRVQELLDSLRSHGLTDRGHELNQRLTVLSATQGIDTSHNGGMDQVLGQGWDLLLNSEIQHLAVQIGNQELASQQTEQSTELLLQLHLSHAYFFCSSTLTLSHIENEERFRETLLQYTSQVKCSTEVCLLLHLDNTNVIRASLDDSSVPCISKGLRLGGRGGRDSEDHLGCCCAALNESLHQSFQRLEVTEELLDTTTSIVLTIDSHEAKGQPGTLVLGSLAVAVRQDLVVCFLVPGPTFLGQLDTGEDVNILFKFTAHTAVNDALYGLGVFKIRTEHLSIDPFTSHDLSHVTVTVSFYNIAIERVHLHTVFAHVEQSVTGHDKMLDRREDLHTISRSSNALHDHAFNLGKA